MLSPALTNAGDVVWKAGRETEMARRKAMANLRPANMLGMCRMMTMRLTKHGPIRQLCGIVDN